MFLRHFVVCILFMSVNTHAQKKKVSQAFKDVHLRKGEQDKEKPSRAFEETETKEPASKSLMDWVFSNIEAGKNLVSSGFENGKNAVSIGFERGKTVLSDSFAWGLEKTQGTFKSIKGLSNGVAWTLEKTQEAWTKLVNRGVISDDKMRAWDSSKEFDALIANRYGQTPSIYSLQTDFLPDQQDPLFFQEASLSQNIVNNNSSVLPSVVDQALNAPTLPNITIGLSVSIPAAWYFYKTFKNCFCAKKENKFIEKESYEEGSHRSNTPEHSLKDLDARKISGSDQHSHSKRNGSSKDNSQEPKKNPGDGKSNMLDPLEIRYIKQGSPHQSKIAIGDFKSLLGTPPDVVASDVRLNSVEDTTTPSFSFADKKIENVDRASRIAVRGGDTRSNSYDFTKMNQPEPKKMLKKKIAPEKKEPELKPEHEVNDQERSRISSFELVPLQVD